MEIQTHKSDVTILGNSHEIQSAKIELNPVIFEILSGKIYSNKIRAVIRELSCNAVDSHKMAGHTKSFDVQLPTAVEQVFRIRDYGVGLAHEDVFNLYMTFGASSKRSSNSLIGGLGIGSKAPLAYTSAFTVTSYFNGEQRSYNVFIDETGCPSTVHFHTAPTDEPNGLEVSVPVKKEDINTFKMEAKYVFEWFEDVKPNFLGESVEIVSYTFQNECKEWGWSGKGYAAVIMGSIQYPLSSKDLEKNTLWEKKYSALIDNGLLLFLKIGEVDVAASRESLSFSTKTQATIINKIKTIFEQEKERLEQELSSKKTTWDLYKFYALGLSGLVLCDLIKDFKYYITLEGDFIGTAVYSGVINKLRKGIILDVHPWKYAGFIFADTSNRITARLKTFFETNNNKYYLIYGDKETFESITKQCDGAEFIYLSNISPDNKYIVKKTTVKKPVETYVLDVPTGSIVCKQVDFENLSSKKVYCSMYDKKFFLTKNGLKIWITSSEITKILSGLGYTEEVYGISVSKIGVKIKKNTNLILFEDFVRRNEKTFWKQYNKFLNDAEILKCVNSDVTKKINAIACLTNNNLIIENYQKSIEEVRKGAASVRTYTAMHDWLFPDKILNVSNTTSIPKAILEGEAFLEKYPLLKWLDLYNNKNLIKKDVLDYIKLVDSASNQC